MANAGTCRDVCHRRGAQPSVRAHGVAAGATDPSGARLHPCWAACASPPGDRRAPRPGTRSGPDRALSRDGPRPRVDRLMGSGLGWFPTHRGTGPRSRGDGSPRTPDPSRPTPRRRRCRTRARGTLRTARADRTGGAGLPQRVGDLGRAEGAGGPGHAESRPAVQGACPTRPFTSMPRSPSSRSRSSSTAPPSTAVRRTGRRTSGATRHWRLWAGSCSGSATGG